MQKLGTTCSKHMQPCDRLPTLIGWLTQSHQTSRAADWTSDVRHPVRSSTSTASRLDGPWPNQHVRWKQATEVHSQILRELYHKDDSRDRPKHAIGDNCGVSSLAETESSTTDSWLRTHQSGYERNLAGRSTEARSKPLSHWKKRRPKGWAGLAGPLGLHVPFMARIHT